VLFGTRSCNLLVIAEHVLGSWRIFFTTRPATATLRVGDLCSRCLLTSHVLCRICFLYLTGVWKVSVLRVSRFFGSWRLFLFRSVDNDRHNNSARCFSQNFCTLLVNKNKNKQGIKKNKNRKLLPFLKRSCT
jgi:hypothetical protein